MPVSTFLANWHGVAGAWPWWDAVSYARIAAAGVCERGDPGQRLGLGADQVLGCLHRIRAQSKRAGSDAQQRHIVEVVAVGRIDGQDDTPGRTQ